MIYKFIGEQVTTRVVAVTSRPWSNSNLKQLDDGTHIPQYPGGTLTEDVRDSSTWRRLEFRVPTDYETMLKFYEEALTQQGWKRLSDTIYTWSDPTEMTPWQVDMYLSGKAFEEKVSGITMILSHWSKIDQLPVYPGTQQFTLITKNNYGARTDLLMYQTGASPTLVAEFYKNELPTYGWSSVDSASKGARDTAPLVFSSDIRGPASNGIRLFLSIQISIDPQGQTHITLQETGMPYDLGRL